MITLLMSFFFVALLQANDQSTTVSVQKESATASPLANQALPKAASAEPIDSDSVPLVDKVLAFLKIEWLLLLKVF